MADINKNALFSYLIYSMPYQYGNITLYPITMEQIVEFSVLKESIIVRKDSHFNDKNIIKMSYLDFLIYCSMHEELSVKYEIQDLHNYLLFAIELIQLVCKDQEIDILNGKIYVNKELITPDKFDDIRRIIILQNDIDFDIDEFIHFDTEQALIKAQNKVNGDESQADIEDYVDSLCIALGHSEEQVMKMSIRKFWRFIKRYNLHESYTICKTGEMSGMVTFNNPIPYWIVSLDDKDKYQNVKADEKAIMGKVTG